jgi:hypothetical protein
MGFGGTETPETPVIAEAEMPSPDEMNTAELQEASIAPITTDEAALYTKTGKACCWADSGEYAFRLRQLEIINHAIKTLAEETWKDAEMISSFQALHRNVMTYKDVDGNEADNHDWSIVAEDLTFKPMELRVNRFKEFQEFFATKAGESKQQIKKDFENYMTIFIRIRDSLMKRMAEQCSESAQKGGGRRYNKRKPVSRRTYY